MNSITVNNSKEGGLFNFSNRFVIWLLNFKSSSILIFIRSMQRALSPYMSNQTFNQWKSGTLVSATRKKNDSLDDLFRHAAADWYMDQTKWRWKHIHLGVCWTYIARRLLMCAKPCRTALSYLTLGWTYTAHQRCNKSIPGCQNLSEGFCACEHHIFRFPHLQADVCLTRR